MLKTVLALKHEKVSELDAEVDVHTRSVGFTGEAAEAVHYALTFLTPLLTLDEQTRVNGRVTQDLVYKPCLELPDVFELMHHANQVTSLLALEAVLGETVCKLDADSLERLGTVSQFASSFCNTKPVCNST